MYDTPGEAKVKKKTMNVGDTAIEIEDVTSIEYEQETDLVVIKWERVYTNQTASRMFKKVGPNALGLKAFIQAFMERIENETDDKLAVLQSVLEKVKR